MKRALCILTLSLFFAAQAPGQVSKEQFKGVWGIVAMGKAGKDTVIILNRDTVISTVFTNHIFSHIADKIYAAKTPGETIAYTILGMFSNDFLQFDGVNLYGEGMKPETPEQKPNVKRGSYSVVGNQLTIKTKKVENFHVEFKGEYMVLTSETGSVMYLKKYSDTLY
jgi:hypothetical protein